MHWDLIIFDKFNSLAGQSASADTLIIFLADYLQYVVGLFLLLFFKKEWRLAFWALAAGAFSRLVLTNLIRWFYNRPRPFVDEQLVYQLIDHDQAGSFPSGHTATFFAIAFFIYLQNKKLGYWFFAAALIISLARISAGLHYPTDILGGTLVGLLAGWLINFFKNKLSSGERK